MNSLFVRDSARMLTPRFLQPMSESVPSSITGFAHRRSRADSVTSFTYMQEGEESSDWTEEEAIIDESDDEPEERDGLYADESSSPSVSRERRKSSGFSRTSFEDPLLPHRDSTATDVSYFGRGKRINQRIYIVTEDLTIVVSGFVTSFMGYASYIILCTLTCGIAYLLLRWLPRWRVRLVGKHKPLRECSWVVVEVRGHTFVLVVAHSLTAIRTNGASLKLNTSHGSSTGILSRQCLA